MSTRYKIVLIEVLAEIVCVATSIYLIRHNVINEVTVLLLVVDFVLFACIFIGLIKANDSDDIYY